MRGRRVLVSLALGLSLILALALALVVTIGAVPAQAAPATGPDPLLAGSAPESAPSLPGPTSRTPAAELRVCPAGPPACDYAIIQEAVAAAAAGDVIKIATGGYDDLNAQGGLIQMVYISKSLTLRGGYTTADWNNSDPVANPTTLNPAGLGRGIVVTGNISVTIEALHITGGDASGLTGFGGADAGGGIYVVSATLTLARNTIDDNAASVHAFDATGVGGGIFLDHSNALLVDNTIANNVAANGGLFADGAGGGLYALSGAPILRGNRILDNQAAKGATVFGDGAGGGLFFAENQPLLEANLILNNQAGGSFDSGGGVRLGACQGFRLVNNVIADNQGDYGGAGLWIDHFSGVPSRGELLHTTIARNQSASGAGVRVAGGSVVTFTNTILAGHNTGINVSFGSTATLTATLWGSGAWANGTDWGDVGDIFTGTINIWGDPVFLSPNSGNYHIGASSAARDQGVDAGVPTDLDGTSRDAQPDLGAYEAVVQGVLQVTKRASAVQLNLGDTVTYTVIITNAGVSSMTHAALTDTLPALQRPLDIAGDQGTCSLPDAGYGGEAICDFGDLSAMQAVHVTVTAQVTTTVPATLPQTMRNTVLAASDQAQNTASVDTLLQDCHARVNGSLPEYSSVQQAVDAAAPGDAVWIAGTCVGAYERAGLRQQVYLDKDLTLQGGYPTDFSFWNPYLYQATLDAQGQGRVIYVTGAVAVNLTTLHLTGGDATGLGGLPQGFGDAGGGLFAITATVTLSGSQVFSNVASTMFDGFGGGIGVTSATLSLVNTTLAGNTASRGALALGYGGGLYSEYSTLRLERSRLERNKAAAQLAGIGGGADVEASRLEAEATLWLSNTVSPADVGFGGGLQIIGQSPFTLTNCVLAGNRADAGGGTGGSGLWADGTTGVLLQPTFARNQGGEAIGLSFTSTVAITNAVIVSHHIGIMAEPGSVATVNGVLWHDNVSGTVTGTVQVLNEHFGDPAFAADGYHLTAASAAIGQGVAGGVPTDLDGQPRGDPPDLGADEYYPGPCYDFDGDGQVEVDDIAAVALRWDRPWLYHPRYDVTPVPADLRIDIRDILTVAAAWGDGCP